MRAGRADQFFDSIPQLAQKAWDFATQQAQAFIDNLRNILNNPGEFLSGLLTGFENFFATVGGLASTFASDLVSTIGSAIRSIIGFVNDAIAAFKRLFSAQLNSKSSSNSGFKATALSK